MKHLEINGIKNKTNAVSFASLSEADRDYVANFIQNHKEEFINKHFELFCNSEFLNEVGKEKVHLLITMLLEVSEYYTIDFLNALIDFYPFTQYWYVCLNSMYINKIEIEENYLENIRFTNTDIELL